MFGSGSDSNGEEVLSWGKVSSSGEVLYTRDKVTKARVLYQVLRFVWNKRFCFKHENACPESMSSRNSTRTFFLQTPSSMIYDYTLPIVCFAIAFPITDRSIIPHYTALWIPSSILRRRIQAYRDLSRLRCEVLSHWRICYQGLSHQNFVMKLRYQQHFVKKYSLRLSQTSSRNNSRSFLRKSSADGLCLVPTPNTCLEQLFPLVFMQKLHEFYLTPWFIFKTESYLVCMSSQNQSSYPLSLCHANRVESGKYLITCAWSLYNGCADSLHASKSLARNSPFHSVISNLIFRFPPSWSPYLIHLTPISFPILISAWRSLCISMLQISWHALFVAGN